MHATKHEAVSRRNSDELIKIFPVNSYFHENIEKSYRWCVGLAIKRSTQNLWEKLERSVRSVGVGGRRAEKVRERPKLLDV